MSNSTILRRLVELRDDPKLLAPDARADIDRLVQAEASGTYSPDLTQQAVYPLLISPDSRGGMALRAALAGYSGDLLSDLWQAQDGKFGAGVGIWIGDVTEALREIQRATGRRPTSDDLIASIILYTTTNVRGVMDGREVHTVSNFGSFLEQREISQRSVSRQLLGLDPKDPTAAIPERYSLIVRIIESGRLKADVVERWGQHSIRDGERELVAPNGLLLPDNVTFLPGEMEEFDRLLNATPPAPEEAFQEFFEAHPKWLYLLGEQYEKLVPQLQLPPVELRQSLGLVDGQIDSGDFFPDFMLKRIGLELWDILDIKRTHPRVVVGGQGRRKFSEAVHEAAAQLREYADRLRQNEVREYLRDEHGVTVARPVAMVVIGRDFEFKTLREKDLLKRSDDVRVYTYDDLRRLASHRTLTV